jgi:AbrB family looped-hinge helix DNA binding protein
VKNMPMVRVLRNGVIQIPKEVREEVGIEEGDYIDMKINGKDTITIHIKDLVDEDDSWYWSEGWQQMEREADEDIKAGRIKTFENIQDLIRELKE